ncbi:MAG: glycosyltransferase [bacterium]
MRILFLGEALSSHLLRWAEEFKKLDWEVLVASCDYDDKFTGHKLTSKYPAGPLRYLSLVGQIKQLIAEFQPFVVNAHFLPTYGLAAALANVHPLILTLWGSDILVSGSRGFWARRRSRFVLGRSDLIVADAECLLAAARQLGPVRRHLVVSFGVRRSWYESGKERELSEGETLRIISTRQHEEIYDLPTLLRAAKILLEEDFPLELTISGSGSLESTLRQLTSELGLAGKTVFVGRLSEERMFSTLRNADIYVSTSRSDSTSVSLLEAMSQKLYPVVTDIPGNREWLENEVHLFPIGDAEVLAQRIKRGAVALARQAAYDEYEPKLRQRGIREQQMQAAHETFLNLIDEFRH